MLPIDCYKDKASGVQSGALSFFVSKTKSHLVLGAIINPSYDWANSVDRKVLRALVVPD